MIFFVLTVWGRTITTLFVISHSGPALGMALASAYAISGLCQTELCNTIYCMQFREDSIQVLSLADCILADFVLNLWFWIDLFTEYILLVPLEA